MEPTMKPELQTLIEVIDHDELWDTRLLGAEEEYVGVIYSDEDITKIYSKFVESNGS